MHDFARRRLHRQRNEESSLGMREGRLLSR
jgi:hypothetical protein